MCNAHFQHLFDDASLPSTSTSSSTFAAPSAAGIAQHQQQQHHQHQQAGSSTRGQLAMRQHEPSPTGHDGAMSTLSPVSTGSWSYPIEAQSDVQMYSPASTASFSGFHSPIEANARAYALAGALQQQQQHQHQQPGTAYPESSQRSTELARGGPGAGHGQGQGHAAGPTPAFQFPDSTQQMTPQQAAQQQQRWGYAGHAQELAQEALSMSRAPIMDPSAHTHAHAPSTSDDSVNSVPPPAHRDGRPRVPSVFGTQNVPGGARVPMAPGAGVSSGTGAGAGAGASAGDQRAQAGPRQIQHQGMPVSMSYPPPFPADEFVLILI